MFKLYYFTYNMKPEFIYSNNDLLPCLDYIKVNNIQRQRCVIITPNNRRISFNEKDVMIVSDIIAA